MHGQHRGASQHQATALNPKPVPNIVPFKRVFVTTFPGLPNPKTESYRWEPHEGAPAKNAGPVLFASTVAVTPKKAVKV